MRYLWCNVLIFLPDALQAVWYNGLDILQRHYLCQSPQLLEESNG